MTVIPLDPVERALIRLDAAQEALAIDITDEAVEAADHAFDALVEANEKRRKRAERQRRGGAA